MTPNINATIWVIVSASLNMTKPININPIMLSRLQTTDVIVKLSFSKAGRKNNDDNV